MSTAETERRKQRVSRVPDKASYTLPEVCEYAKTQPYVVRFWESEFPQLRPIRERGGSSVYSRRDLDLVLRIKSLLDGEERTISEARRMLEGQSTAEASSASAEASAIPRTGRPARNAKPPAAPLAAAAAPTLEGPAALADAVARERYEGALEEIAHLRLELNEALTQRRKAEAAERSAVAEARAAEARVQRAAAVLEAWIARLS